ncbi:hypothetical protein F4860DRAFT_270644 [Xylaria cubensis]|nr:hypothetical protein F4860DRAFT_270644 [Xylaria cubensis]
MGSAQFHVSSQTTSLISRTPCTPTYRAPEYDLISARVNMTSAYDIWSLGCMFLEFAIWFVAGDAQRRAFGRNKVTYDKDGAFFITRGGNFVVNPAVSCELERLMAISESFAPILHEIIVSFQKITKSCLELEEDNRPTAELLRGQLQSLRNSVGLMMTSLQKNEVFMNEPAPFSHIDIARMLVRRGVEGGKADCGGHYTPPTSKIIGHGTEMMRFIPAALIKQFEVSQLLVNGRANINTQSGYHETALQVALSRRHDKSLMWFLFNEADTDANTTAKHSHLKVGKKELLLYTLLRLRGWGNKVKGNWTGRK